MPPKKRQKTASSNQKAVQPQNVSEVASGRIALKDWIGLVYGGRHGFSEKRKYPLDNGGSYLDIVQRVWCDESFLVEHSLALVKKLGIVDNSISEEDFLNKYMTMKDTR